MKKKKTSRKVGLKKIAFMNAYSYEAQAVSCLATELKLRRSYYNERIKHHKCC